METNYSRWKPILLVCRFSDLYFMLFLLQLVAIFLPTTTIQFLLFSPPLSTPLALPLPPLRFMASVNPTTPLSLLPFTTKQISESSSNFSLFSDRNFLGMDEKFAISLGWDLHTSRPCCVSVPSFNLSLLFPCWRPLHNFQRYPTGTKL